MKSAIERPSLIETQDTDPKSKGGNWKKIKSAAIYQCTVCGQFIITDDVSQYNYCSRCGTKMEKEDG